MSLLKDWPARATAEPEDVGVNPTTSEPFVAIAGRRLSRRLFLAGASGLAVSLSSPAQVRADADASDSTLTYRSLPIQLSVDQAVAQGYRADVLIRWGDPVLGGAPSWAVERQSADAQARQFGYNNDFIAYLPLEGSRRGLLHVNHEYCEGVMMFPGWTVESRTAEQARIEMAAMGGSLLEIEQSDTGLWRVVPQSPLARRITASTPMTLSGPAAGHRRLRTHADPEGRRVLGTLNNCAGGTTPWGTVLMAEENFNYYFDAPANAPETAAWRRYGLAERARYPLSLAEERFDLAREPNEANRFGWVVEYDPRDPNSTPTKRTALGRFKHEGATCVLNGDGRVVVYSGDDERFDYLYRFVSTGRYDAGGPGGAGDLLDAGILSVAVFDDDGLVWRPLIFGEGPLTPENGFRDQGDVLIEARRAADLIGATPMDRPEDVAVDSRTGRVFVMLTNNNRRGADRLNPANPYVENLHGHVLDLTPPQASWGPDHAAERFGWDVFVKAGPPSVANLAPTYHPDNQAWFASPDNAAFDPQGRLWVSTDRGGDQQRDNAPDGLFGCDISGPGRALFKMLYAAPVDAELTGQEFTPDGRTVFVAVQHPGEGDGSTCDTPSTRWPDFDPSTPPRPSVVAVRRADGEPIGN
ncbi:PhoX family phosphatase [Brevundimonas albigilva]|uniref:PhoX family protein n=1 Tax=Brevundimonas albigilva TaxID=1312364 RepID=UPI00201B951D|nr:PhoX family phosphatase [Brevundimonas albigilva]UQV18954.1 PhoX family phosphatase [Brevundimonas albigilva]